MLGKITKADEEESRKDHKILTQEQRKDLAGTLAYKFVAAKLKMMPDGDFGRFGRCVQKTSPEKQKQQAGKAGTAPTLTTLG